MISRVRRKIDYAAAVQVGLEARRCDALLSQIVIRNRSTPEEPRVSPATAHFAAVLMLSDQNARLSGPAALAEAETLVSGKLGGVIERMVAAMLELEAIGQEAIVKESERTSISRLLKHIVVEAESLTRTIAREP